MYVSTLLQPTPARTLRKSAIGNLPVDPTFTARSKITKVGMDQPIL
jgi:hypothetical protein